ncbi:MAG TPA: hypothetical protein VNT30_05055 [Stellaceae bacterium]|nr:hypothetical protein [Stellaceae bacterium]
MQERLTDGISVEPSVTKLGPAHRGSVLVAGSHGGRYAAWLAVRAGVRGVILNDAGRGLEDAGIAGIHWLDDIELPAATVDAWSARIGDGADMMARGRISAVNRTAAALGCAVGMAALDAARAMTRAPLIDRAIPMLDEGRQLLRAAGAQPAIWALDSAALVRSEDAGAVLIIGSHGGAPGGDPARALQADALAAVFNDAGIGIDRAGLSRLPMLDSRGIAAATVGAATARIGEGDSAWRTGIISVVNDTAREKGGRPGQTVPDFVATITTTPWREPE